MEKDDCKEDNIERDVAEGDGESQMPQEQQASVINVGLLCFRYLEEYQTQ